MKKSILTFAFIVLASFFVMAQSPEKVQYQTVVRDNAGQPIANQNIGLRINIHQGSAAGPTVFSETHNVVTNDFGLANFQIGAGTPVSGTIAGIDWGSDEFHLETELDATGGSSYVTMGTSQLLSVPYALSAKKVSDMAMDDLTDVQGVPGNNEILKWNGSNWAPAADDAGTNYTAGTGITISGSNAISADLGVEISTAEIQNDAVTTPKILDDAITAPKIDDMGANNGEVLKWNGADWAPATDAGTNYTAGNGITISGSNAISTDLGVDIATAEIQNNAVTTPKILDDAVTAPKIDDMGASNGEVLKWNGVTWAPAVDNAGSSVWNLSGSDAYYNAGDVGIGTSTPSAKLEVSQNSSLSDPHIHLHENGNDYSRINFDNNNGSNYWTIAAYIATNNNNDRLNFWNGTSGDLMSLTGDGRLGIGVGISPKTTLHVKNDGAVLFGTDTIGPGDKLLWLPRKHAFRVGTIAAGAASNYWHPDSMGLYSFASGYNTRAQGFGATAMGRDTEASNSYAFASGFFSNADGQYSTAMGFNTDAMALGSTALGYSTDAEEYYSFAAGYFAEAQAIYSVAIGNAVQAQSYASIAVGRYNVGGGTAASWVANDPIFEIGIGTGPSNRENAITVQKDGDVGIGTTFPGAKLHVANGNIRIGSLEEFSDGGSFLIQVNSAFAPETNGNRTLGNSTFRWSTVYATNGTINTSDRRDKTSIKDLNYGLLKVMALNPVSYKWKEHPEQGVKLGLIAQDLQKVLPEVVAEYEWVPNEETGELEKQKADRLGVYYSDLIPVLIKGMQEQQELIEQLQESLAQQEVETQKLNKELQSLKANTISK